jgi:hypothetical protein
MSWFVCILSIVSGCFFATTDVQITTKLVAVGLVVVSLVMQFVPALHVPFIVPFLAQIAVCIWVAIYWQTG